MRISFVHLCLLTLSAHVVGCNATQAGDDGQGGSSGARTSSNAGASSGARGGTTAGGSAGTGGTLGSGTGGSTVSAGGAGAKPAGGATGAGGASSGGAAASGGAPGSGGVPGTGGTHATGGAPNTAGSTSFGGAPGAGGAKTGGAPGSGGVAFGGAAGTGGAGAGMAGAPAEMCAPGSHSTNGTQHCGMSDSGTADGNYTYNIYSDGKGSGCMTTYGVDATFSATWTNVGDWIARVGLAFDKTKTYDKIGVFSSDFSYTMTGITTGGFGNVGIYGWSVNPLHEYYIIENWLGKKPAFTVVGSFTIDGEGTYEIQTNMQKNQPNITGTNADFVQFWSVRSEPRQCGHISVSKHFDEWKSLNLTLGNLEEVRILVEAQNNSGAMDFTTATVVVQ
ncbi:MAG TPA: glycoside hydrolase family 11 protein [Polyangiaceae bacterium]|nr:glycoside hydrolase family 11 protein [Polyangiaceae bacterium]